MSFQLNIPINSGSPLECTLNVGQILFVLGANGTGKSSLMHRLNRNYLGDSRWISAHRQNWFSSESNNLSPQKKRQIEDNNRLYEAQADSRWKSHNAGDLASIAIYELVESENIDARAIAKAVRADDSKRVEELKKTDPPLRVINELLKASNIPIELSLRDNELVMASKFGSEPYSIAQLSDGERNALIIAANVLTTKPGRLILVDEPERHLHRSIISPLLTQLFRKRRDCAFIVSTHDVLLPLDNPKARTLLIRGCRYRKAEIATWEADLVPSETEINEVLKGDILGSRKKILFVEGTDRSLDQPLYSLVFPEVSVVSKSSCREVEQAVTGIRGAENLHWLRAFGIVDSDARPATEIEELKQQGVYAVPAYSVEALYYHPEIQRRVTERHAAVTGANPQTQLANAQIAALTAIRGHADRMSEKVAEKAIRAEVFRNIPGKAEVRAGLPFKLGIDIAGVVATERARLDAALAANALEALVVRYPVRETPALSHIAEQLGFQDRDQYESAVQKLLMDDTSAVTFVRSLFGTLWDDIAT